MDRPMLTHFSFVRADDWMVKTAYGRLQVKNAVEHYRKEFGKTAAAEIDTADDVGDEDLERARLMYRNGQYMSQATARHFIRLCDQWDALLKKHAQPAEDEEIEKLFAPQVAV